MKLINIQPHEQKRSVQFYKYFFSYIFIVVILFGVVGIAVYGSFITSLQSEVEKSNTASLLRIRDTMDSRLKEMERMAIQITGNPRLSPSMINRDSYESLQAIKDLRSYNSANSFIDNIALYHKYKNSEKIFASSGLFTLEDFFGREYQFNSFSMEDFIGLMNKIKFPTMRPVEKVVQSFINHEAFAIYFYPIPANSGAPYGAVIYFINETTLKDTIRNALNNSGYSYILNEEGTPIISVSSGDTQISKNEMLEKINAHSLTQAISTKSIQGESYSIVKFTSDYNGWSYITVMPTTQFLKPVYNSQRVFVGMAVIVLIIGLCMAFILATNNYKPIRNMVRILQSQDKNKDLHKNNDEISYITRTIDKVTSENRNLVSSLKSKASMMKDQVILTLLRGNFENREQIDNLADASGVRLEGQNFVVLLFLIDDYQRFANFNPKSIRDLLKFSIINVVVELAANAGTGYGIDLLDDGGTAAILSLNNDIDNKTYIEDLAYRAKEFFKENFNFTLTIGIGNVYRDLFMIHQSFIEASRAVHYRLVKGNDCVIFYSDLAKLEENSKYKYPKELETRLISSIKQGKSEDIECLTKDIIKDIVEQSLSPETAQFVCFGIINSILKVVDEISVPLSSAIDKDIEDLFTRKYETVDSFGKMVNELILKICMNIENNKKSKNFDLRDKIIQFVKENYCDENITLDMIACKFELSSSYITRFFKEQTGYPLMHFIDIMRMEKAKEMLKSTDIPLREIIQHIGYLSETHFIRKFKKYEGITPAHYRNLVSTKG